MLNHKKYNFIVFEGGEGSGKTTMAKLFSDYLTSRNTKNIIAVDPGGTEVGYSIRKILLSPAFNTCKATEFLLYQASRSQLIYEVIKPNLKEGKIVISDRFIDSTRVYQGKMRGWPQPILDFYESVFVDDCRPNLTILLDIDPKVGVKRSLNRLTEQEIDEAKFEKLPLDFHIGVREGFLELANNNPSMYIVVDSTKSVDEVYTEVIAEFEKRIKV